MCTKMRTMIALLLIAFMLLQGCAIKDIRVKEAISELKPELNSYGWLATVEKQDDPWFVRKHLDEFVKAAVDAELEEKGYAKVPPEDGPTFWATYHVAIQDVVKSVKLRDLQRLNRYKTEVYHIDYQNATLVLDFIGSDKSTLYWHGSAVAMGHTYDPPEKCNRRIGQAAERIMGKFPAKSQSSKNTNPSG